VARDDWARDRWNNDDREFNYNASIGEAMERAKYAEDELKKVFVKPHKMSLFGVTIRWHNALLFVSVSDLYYNILHGLILTCSSGC